MKKREENGWMVNMHDLMRMMDNRRNLMMKGKGDVMLMVKGEVRGSWKERRRETMTRQDEKKTRFQVMIVMMLMLMMIMMMDDEGQRCKTTTTTMMMEDTNLPELCYGVGEEERRREMVGGEVLYAWGWVR